MKTIIDTTIHAWQFWIAVAGLFGLLVKLWTQFTAFRHGMVALLRAQIVAEYNKYSVAGYCPIYARENVDALYKQYHKLGGNGQITGLFEKLMALPTEKKGKR